ncbi:MAG TPA: hypothetical protein VE077_13190 [Candidatus Methylomirabilis sp.]|nr:hypothetical protein [Candidatus Methylomirabilis sp.]
MGTQEVAKRSGCAGPQRLRPYHNQSKQDFICQRFVRGGVDAKIPEAQQGAPGPRKGQKST